MSPARREKPSRVLRVSQTGTLGGSAVLFEGGQLVSAGPGATFEAVVGAAVEHAADIVVVDLWPGDGALLAIRALMAERPTPILGLRPPQTPASVAFEALGLGALEVTDRPAAPAAPFWEGIAHTVRLLAGVRVVRHMGGKRQRPARPVPGDRSGDFPPFPVVAIGASLGGPQTLACLLSNLPRPFPAPVAICQHITVGFTTELASWLSGQAARRVVEAVDGERLHPGEIYVAPSGTHFTVAPEGRIVLEGGPPLGGFKPSCDALLTSVATAFHRRAVGVILTGLGRDGAMGLKAIRVRGGRTIAQDEQSSIAFSMPKEAIEAGGAERVLSLEDIAPTLGQLVSEC